MKHKETYQQELDAALIVRDRIKVQLESINEMRTHNRQRIAELRLKIEQYQTNKPVNS